LIKPISTRTAIPTLCQKEKKTMAFLVEGRRGGRERVLLSTTPPNLMGEEGESGSDLDT
jgi:hypothetical protein